MSTRDQAHYMLQWGHRLSAMETIFPAASALAPPEGASMGPPPFGDGNGAGLDPKHPANIASMGPPPFGDGNRTEGVDDPIPTGYASMGPPSFGDGNGAVVVVLLDLDDAASMGPPPFGDGNALMLGAWEYNSPGFNGATAFRRWKLLSTTPRHIIVDPLQWGHRLSAMETNQTPTAEALGFLLQWGHRLSAMETHWSIPRPPRSNCGLQWGHRLSAMETQPLLNIPGMVSVLQWGHRLSAMETPRTGDYHPSQEGSFNGATAFRRWKLSNTCLSIRSCFRFNGATAFRRWKRPAW